MDARFDTSKDQRFKKVPQNVRKVKVDKRFAHMFDDKNFVETPLVDSRGQRLHKDTTRNKMREFYELAHDKPTVPEQSPTSATPATASGSKRKALRTKKVLSADDDEVGDDEQDKHQEQNDQGSESSEEESSDTAEEVEAEDGEAWSEDEDVPRGDATTRLALMGCDWDQNTSADLIAMLRTYLSSKESRRKGGNVERVAVYPSQYGLEQIKIESTSGPQSLTDSNLNEDEEGGEAKMNEAVRKYQLQRTKYYYAVAFCDSAATAAWLYDNLDGLDADGLCPGMLDLRFVPDDLEFPHPARDEATDAPSKYQGPSQQASALRHSKVHCTWDEPAAHRKRDLMKKRFTPQELEKMDLDAYLASTSGEDSDGAGAEALKSLVQGAGADGFSDMEGSSDDGATKDVQGDMEATFNIKADKLEEELEERAKEAKAGGKVHTLESEKPKSTWAAYLEKRKQKKKDSKAKAKAEKDKRKGIGEGKDEGGDDTDSDAGNGTAADGTAGAAELEMLAGESDDDNKRGFNVRGKMRMGKKRALKESKKETPGGDFKIDTEDPRIARVFAGGDFDIDPQNPQYRPSAGMQAVLKKKRNRKLKPTAAADGMAPSQSLRPPAISDGPLAPVPASRPSGIGSGGLQLFAGKRPTPAGEGQQVAAHSQEKRGMPQGVPSQEAAKLAPRKKRKGATS